MRRRSMFVFLAVWAMVALVSIHPLEAGNPSDFQSFYGAAKALRQGLDPYDVRVLQGLVKGRHVFPYLYSPLLALLLMPLTHWNFMPAFRFWTIFSAGAFGLTTAVTTHHSRLPAFHRVALGSLTALVLNLLNVLELGQINAVVLVPIAFAYTLRERRPVVAGICLGLAGLLKSSPFYLVVLFAAERRWRLVAATFATAIVTSALTVPVVGVATWEGYLRVGQLVSRLEPIPGLFPFDHQVSFSFVAVLMRAGLNARLYGPALTVILTVPIAVSVWRGRARGALLSALVVMVLNAPLAYTQHALYLAPGVLVALELAVARRRPRVLYPVLVLFFAFAAGIDFPLGGHAGRNFSAFLALYVLGFLA